MARGRVSQMDFEIVGEFRRIETFATGKGIRELRRLVRTYGPALWRKRKGFAYVRLADGSYHLAELIGMKRPESAAKK